MTGTAGLQQIQLEQVSLERELDENISEPLRYYLLKPHLCVLLGRIILNVKLGS